MNQNLEDKIKRIKDSTSYSLKKSRTSRYSYIDYEDVIDFFGMGLKMPQIAEVYNCSLTTLKRQIKKQNPKFDGRKSLHRPCSCLTGRL